MNFDVLIAGGGVIGLSIARELNKKGVDNIAVVESGICGEKASWAAAGMLGLQAEWESADPFYSLCKRSSEMYPAFSAGLLDETDIDIELDRSGTLHLAFSQHDLAGLDLKFQKQIAAGLSLERLSDNDVRKAEPFVTPDVLGGLYFANDWQVDNRKLVGALKHFAELNGISLIENTPVERIIIENGKAVGVKTNTGVFNAGHVVAAAGAWTSLVKLDEIQMPLKVEPVRGQIIAYRTAKRLFEHVIYSERGYLVPRRDGRILAGATSEHAGFDDVTTEAAAESLKQMAFEISPSLSGLSVADHWSGLRPFAADGLPILGGLNGIDDLTIATAHYRNGILLAPVTADIIASRIVNGDDSPAFTTYGADRFALAADNASNSRS